MQSKMGHCSSPWWAGHSSFGKILLSPYIEVGVVGMEGVWEALLWALLAL